MSLEQSTPVLHASYMKSQRKFSVEEGHEYGPLVVPNGNHELAVHRWFHFKEAYSSRLVHQVLADTGLVGKRNLRVLDPYAGCGTTAVSLADMTADGVISNATTYGIETNGFLHLLASTKLQFVQNPPHGFLGFAKRISRAASTSRATTPSLPELSTFQQEAYFDRADVEQLVRIRHFIDIAEADGSDALHIALARVCLGGIVENVSNLRRDGRALRYVEKKSRPATVKAFLAKATQIAGDVGTTRVPIRGRIVRGDGRGMEELSGRYKPFDLVLFSPPYPNNIDYTEIYKLENWLLGYISDAPSFMAQRLQTVYSHPSLLRDEPLPSPLLSTTENAKVAKIISQVSSAMPDGRYAKGRRRMLTGYARDMYLTLRSSKERLADDGWIVYVVGNSVHGQQPAQVIIAADLIIAELAELAGLSVEKIAIARYLRRRSVSSPLLRESVVFLRNA